MTHDILPSTTHDIQVVQTAEDEFTVIHDGVHVIKKASRAGLDALSRALAPFTATVMRVIVEYNPFELDDEWDVHVPLRYEAFFRFTSEAAAEAVMEEVEEEWYDHKIPRSSTGTVSLKVEFVPTAYDLPEGTVDGIVDFLKVAYRPIIGPR